MADKCSPVRLPIQIEPSCAPRDCGCSQGGNSICSINNPFASQNSYQNECTSDIQETPTLQIAFLSNVRSNEEADTTITLNPVTIGWCDFLSLFYRVNNVFSVNPTNANVCAINFSSQTFENTTSKTVKFNLAQQVRSTWATKCETTIDNIPPKTNLVLNKQTFGVNSLINAVSCVALTLDQAIDVLLDNGEITPDSTNKSGVEVRFVVQYKYTFQPLNTTVLVNFVFITNIPCYSKLNFCDDWCPYSSDKNCRNCGDLAAETDDIMAFLNNNYKNLDNNANDDSSEFNDLDSISQIKDFAKQLDEQTHVSMDSSKW